MSPGTRDREKEEHGGKPYQPPVIKSHGLHSCPWGPWTIHWLCMQLEEAGGISNSYINLKTKAASSQEQHRMGPIILTDSISCHTALSEDTQAKGTLQYTPAFDSGFSFSVSSMMSGEGLPG